MQSICAKNHEGPKCPSVIPFKILHSEGPFEVASFEHFGLERLHYGGHDCFTPYKIKLECVCGYDRSFTSEHSLDTRNSVVNQKQCLKAQFFI